MRYTIEFVALFLLAGCAGSPPTPPNCEGDFRPVNKLEQKGALLDGATKLALCTKGKEHA